MGHLLTMVAKDLRRDLRSPLAILLTLSFPLLFAGLLGVTFGGGDQPSLPKVKMLLEDRDDAIVGQLLLSAFTSEQMAEYFEVEKVGVEGRARLENGEASALLVIPDDFTTDLLANRPTRLELVRNPEQQILPEVAEQMALVLAEVLSAAARVLGEPLSEVHGMVEGEGPSSSEQIGQLAKQVYEALELSGTYLFPPAITVSAVELEDPDATSSPASVQSIFLYVLPGIAVFALFLIGDHAMRDLLTEDRLGTLRRQLAGPLGAGTVIAGKVAHTAALASLSLLVLSAVAWGVAGGAVDLPAFVLLSACLIVLVTGSSALIYGLARDQNQGATIASVVYLFLAFCGGSFIQLESLPGVLQTVAPYTPFAWATLGFRALLVEAGGLGDVLQQAALLAGLGSICLVAGSRLLERRLRA